MSTINQYKKSWESIRNRTLKEKIEYLLYYYKWYFIGILLFLSAIIQFIYGNVTAKEIALNGIFVNANTTPSALAAFEEDLNSKLAIDTSKYEISLNTNLSYLTDSDGDSYNYQLFQSLQVWYTAGEIDFLVGNLDFMTLMAYQGFFVDLSKVLTQEEYSFYKPYIYYIDRDILDSDNLSVDISLPTGTDPSDMKDPVPVFIDMSNCNELSSIYNHNTSNLFFGIMPNSSNMERAKITLNYLMDS